jgi:hypothetical protein
MNICMSQADTAHEQWAYLKKNFLDNKDHDVLDRLQSEWVPCKQGPEQTFLDRSAAFHHLQKQLQDLGDKLATSEQYVFAIFKRSLNTIFAEILRPLEVVRGGLTYKEARTELLCLEVGGKVYSTIPSMQMAGGQSVGMISDTNRPNPQGVTRQAKGKNTTCSNCGRRNHTADKCLIHIVCHSCGGKGHYQRDCKKKVIQQKRPDVQFKGFCDYSGQYGHKARDAQGKIACESLNERSGWRRGGPRRTKLSRSTGTS